MRAFGPLRRPPGRGGRLRNTVALLVVVALVVSVLVATIVTNGPRRAPSELLLTGKVVTRSRGIPIPPSFLGFSMEWSTVTKHVGSPALGPNRVYDQLLANLAAYGGGVPTLRVGGNSQDEAFWDPSGRLTSQDVSRGLKTPITHMTMRSLLLNTTVTGQRMILGLNLAADDPSLAQAEARAMLSRLPRRRIIAFTIGNEPDLYHSHPKSTRYSGGRAEISYFRSPSYSAARYLREWERVAAAVARLGRGLPLAGTDGLGRLISPARFIARERRQIAIFAAHSYPLSTADSRGMPYAPGSPRYPTLGKLLSPAYAAVSQVVGAAIAGRRSHLPVYIDEWNSAAPFVRRVVSGSLGASLWILQQLFTDAALGIRGTDLHIENFDEAPFGTGFAVTRAGSRVSAGWAGPLYYALLAFAQAAGRHGRLLQSSFWTRAPKHRNVHLYEVLQPDGSLRIVVINEDLNHSGRVRILSPGSRGAGSLVRLIGPKATSVRGVTFAGQSVAAPTYDGRLTGHYHAEIVRPSRGAYTVFMPRASAATLSVPAG